MINKFNTENHPKVAILMATFNGSQFIKEQIESFQKQKYVQINIFVSDDNSTDETVNIIKNSKFEENNTLKILTEIDTRLGAGQNFFRLVKDVPLNDYEYFAFSDQDDIWKAYKLNRAINQLKIKNADGYSSSVDAFWANGRNKYIKKDYPQKKFDYFFEAPGPGCTFVMNRKLFLNLKNFIILNYQNIGDIYYHDWFIYAFSRTKNYKWIIDNRSYINYRQHEGNDTGANIGFIAKILRFKAVWNYWAGEQAYRIAKLLKYENIYILYFSRSPSSILRLCMSYSMFRRSKVDGLVILVLGIFGRLWPQTIYKKNKKITIYK